MKFLLNGQPVTVTDLPPTTTLLQYLRQSCALPGTKEGCAEGDCGACTVAISDIGADGRVRHRAVNACIQFMPALHGKAVTTVEGVAIEGKPHPVQQAMVDCHASQCGFCTPGFVMSLYADFRKQAPRAVTRQEVDCLLAGNLCRCTGWRTIFDAWDLRTVLDGANLNQDTAGYITGYKSYRDGDLRKRALTARAKADKLRQAGHHKEALEAYESFLYLPAADEKTQASALSAAMECLAQLNQIDRTDEILEILEAWDGVQES